jgi:hypothetical protein
VPILREAILKYQRQTIHNICDTAKLLYGMFQQILFHELNMRCTTAKYVPKLLSNGQKGKLRCHLLCLKSRPKITPTSFPPSLLVMTLRFTDTTLAQSSNHLRRISQIHHDPRKYEKFKTSYQCWFFLQWRHHAYVICSTRTDYEQKFLLQCSEKAAKNIRYKRPVK